MNCRGYCPASPSVITGLGSRGPRASSPCKPLGNAKPTKSPDPEQAKLAKVKNKIKTNDKNNKNDT